MTRPGCAVNPRQLACLELCGSHGHPIMDRLASVLRSRSTVLHVSPALLYCLQPDYSSKGWSLSDHLVALPASVVAQEVAKHGSVPLLYLAHPVGVVPDAVDGSGQGAAAQSAGGGGRRQRRFRRRQRRLLQQGRPKHSHDSPNDVLKTINFRFRTSNCRALLVSVQQACIQN